MIGSALLLLALVPMTVWFSETLQCYSCHLYSSDAVRVLHSPFWCHLWGLAGTSLGYLLSLGDLLEDATEKQGKVCVPSCTRIGSQPRFLTIPSKSSSESWLLNAQRYCPENIQVENIRITTSNKGIYPGGKQKSIYQCLEDKGSTAEVSGHFHILRLPVKFLEIHLPFLTLILGTLWDFENPGSTELV